MNIPKLKGIMAEQGKTQLDIAQKIGKRLNTVNSRFAGKTSFDVKEAEQICDLLGITDNATKVEIFLSERPN